jgi:hypothetical protein
MQNNTTDLPSIHLDNLGAVTGGYLDHDPPSPPPKPDYERQRTSGPQQSRRRRRWPGSSALSGGEALRDDLDRRH